MALQGFFKIKDQPGQTLIHSKAPSRQEKIEENFRAGEPQCSKCGLDLECKNPRMPVTGKGLKKILLLGEFPGSVSDISGKHFMGAGGDLLRSELKSLGFDPDEDFWMFTSVSCRPPKGRTPKLAEILACRPRVLQVIEDLKPEQIWVFGAVGVQSLYKHRFSTLGITRWVGWCIPDYTYNSYVVPLYCPSFVAKKEKDKNLLATFKKDLAVAKSRYGSRIPEKINLEAHIKPLFKFSDVVDLLERIIKDKPEITIDFEANRLKPYPKGSKLLTVAITIEDGTKFGDTYAFPFMWRTHWRERQFTTIFNLFTQILSDPEIKKVAQNSKFEDMWVKVILKVIDAYWIWCTMNGQHLVDERPNTTGLKWQGFCYYGIEGYDDEIKPYMKSDENGFNKLEEAPLERVLIYNGADTLITRLRKIDQEKHFNKNPGLKKAFALTMRGLHTFGRMQYRGLGADKKYYESTEMFLDMRIKRLEMKLLCSEEAFLFRSRTGKTINPNSSKDLQLLLFDFLGLESKKKTEAGNASVDVDSLVEIDNSFVKTLLSKRKFSKVKDTYLSQFLREVGDDGRIHAFFDLHVPRTHRSSSSDPNLHNIPVRDEAAKKYCRSGIVPRPGCRFAEGDYGSQEVRMIACWSQDPVLVAYINDPTTDMHRDQAADIWIAETSNVSKMMRFHAKNGQVFPMFYTSWYKSCAHNLWNSVVLANEIKTEEGVPIADHLASKGISTYEQFELHMKGVENRFWNKFKVVKKRQEEAIQRYLKLGYVEMFFGHRRSGHLSRAEVINSSIQGPGFHCLLWTLNRVDEIAEAEKWDSWLVNQVHDSAITDLVIAEQDHVLKTYEDVATRQIREEHPWIIVPLEWEQELCPIDGSWYDKEEVKYDDKNKAWVGKKSGKVYDENY